MRESPSQNAPSKRKISPGREASQWRALTVSSVALTLMQVATDWAARTVASLLQVSGSELTRDVGDVRLADVREAGGLDKVASGELVFMR